MDDVRKLIGDRIESSLDSAIRELSEYAEVSPERALLYAKLSLTLECIVRDRGLLAELKKELPSSLGLRKPEAGAGPRAIAERVSISDDIYRVLMKKRRLRVADIVQRNAGRWEILQYIALRKFGLLKRGKGGELLINRGALLDESKLANLELTAADIKRYLGEVPSPLWSRVITPEFLRSLSDGELFEFAKKYYGYNDSVDRRLARSIAERLRRGALPSDVNDKLRKALAEALRGAEVCDPRLLPYVSEYKCANVNELVKKLAKLPLAERHKIVSFISKRPFGEEILRGLDPITLSALNVNARKGDPVSNKAVLGKAISNYIAYLLTKEEGYLNYSVYLAETVDPESLDPRLRPLLHSLLKADSKALLAHLSRLMPFESLEVISGKVWEEAALRGSPERETLLRAIELGMRILQGVYSRRGAPRGVARKSPRRGRLAIRETIIKRLRFSEELVYRSKKRAPRVVALLDVSGSMYRYALWAILSLASISNVTASVVLFSERASAYKFPKKKLRPLLAKYLERWLSEGFRGYTDISGALRTADAICERLGCDTIVIFSDLEQTVPGEMPWDVARGLVKRGRRIIAFVPSGAEAEFVEAMRASGCEVEEVADPERIPNILKRLIHV